MSTQRETDEAQVMQQVARLAEGIRGRDLEVVRSIYASDVVSFDVEPPLRHVGADAKMSNWAKVFTIFEKPDYEVRDLTVVVGDDVAFGYCFGRLHGTLATGTVTEGVWVRGTFCFRKIDDAWLVVHDQASLPVDVLTGKAAVDLEP